MSRRSSHQALASSSHPSSSPPNIRRPRCLLGSVELLESRTLLSISVNAAQTVRAVNTDLLGVNIATWNSTLTDANVQPLVAASGIDAFRIAGGGFADTFHFNLPNGGDNGVNSLPVLAKFVQTNHAVGLATVDYGSGSPEEGAAMLAYLNAPINDPAVDNVVLGNGEQWNGSEWVQKNWQTVGYWADLRAATPLAHDDGLNFLRIGQSAPFAFHYWEIGNEEYGSFEVDNHGKTGDSLPMPNGASPKAHDPTTYVSFIKQFAALAAQIDPSISIGLSTQDPGNAGTNGFGAGTDGNWINDVLTQCASQGVMPGFLSDHIYPQGPGAESDAFLLGVTDTTTNSSNPYDLAQRAAAYRADLANALGSAGNNVELLATELNSVYTSPGKQSTSIVNALYIADSLGNFLLPGANGAAGYDGMWVWDLLNSTSLGNNDSSSLYGWRQFGDYGMIGTGGGGATGDATDTTYPDYYAEQISSKIVQSGGTVVSATSDVANGLDAFSVLEPNGDLDLMVINKNAPAGTSPNISPDPTVTDQIDLQGFSPTGQATVYQYGVAEDNAQANTGTTGLTTLNTSVSINNGSFSYAFPDYSITVLDLQHNVTAAVSNGLLTIEGTANADTISVSAAGGNIVVDSSGSLVNSFPANQVNSVLINGVAGADSITVGAGVPPSNIQGGGGPDTIVSNNGHDILQGGKGADSLSSTGSHNQLFGDRGADTLSSKGRKNLLSGGPGDDFLVDRTANSADTLQGNGGSGDIAEGFASDDAANTTGVESTVTSNYTFDLSATTPPMSSNVTFISTADFNYNPTVPNVRAESYGDATGTPTLSSQNSTLGNPMEVSPSGSIALPGTFNFAQNGSNNTAAYTIDLFPQAGVVTANSISFDIMVDPTSATDSYGGYGFLNVATRGTQGSSTYVYQNITTGQIGTGIELGSPSGPVPTAGQWYHITAPLDSSDDSVQAVTFQLYGGSAQDLTGNVTYYIDNLELGT